MLGPDGSIALDISTGQHTWTDVSAAGFPRRLVMPVCNDATLAIEIEDLMIASLSDPNEGLQR